MTKGRPLTEREAMFVQNMREQARIRAEIIRLETKTRRAHKTSAAEQRLTDLRAQLLALQTRRNKNPFSGRMSGPSVPQSKQT